jgi:hypothetical protein
MSVVVAVKVLADAGTAALRLFGDDLTREDASKLLEMWAPMRRLRVDDDATADEVTHLVLGRFLPAELPTDDGKDWLDPVRADADAIVERVVPKRPPWSAYGPCSKCGVGAGEQCVFTRNFLGAGAGSPRQIAHQMRPLVEVTAQPTAEVTGPACADCGHAERSHSRLHCAGDVARCGCWAFRTAEQVDRG